MKIDPITATKLVTTGAASWGAGVVVKNAIKMTTPADITNMKKVGVFIGSMAIAGIVSDAASRYTGNIVDQCAEAYNAVKNGTKVHVVTDVENP